MCILCMIFGIGLQAEAAEGTVFRVENQTGKAGDIVTVPIEIHSGTEVGGFELTVYYDKESLEFESLSKGQLIEEGSSSLFDYNHKEENASVKIVYVVADTVKADGTIALIEFKLKKDFESELPIGMEVDEVVDNSDSSNKIVGEVTGVNKEFQERINKETDGITTANGENTASNDTNDDSESDNEQNLVVEENQTKQESTKENDNDNYNSKVLIGGIIIIIAIGGIVVGVKKRK